MTDAEADAVAYGIAAHTHYLQEQKVRCKDGVERMVKPFPDTVEGKPVPEVWFPRWADRLDCNGPCFVGRHYLTVHRDHHDFGKEGFYAVSFADHLQLRNRTPEEIKAAQGKPPRSMLEHCKMFGDSQTNASPYGVHDHGLMRALRDEYRASLDHILQRVVHPTDVRLDRVFEAWTIFLGTNIEPSTLGRVAAVELSLGFARLEPAVQRAWACGFRATMTEYLAWSDRMLAFLNGLPASHLSLPGLFPDIRQVIAPDPAWLAVLTA